MKLFIRLHYIGRARRANLKVKSSERENFNNKLASNFPLNTRSAENDFLKEKFLKVYNSNSNFIIISPLESPHNGLLRSMRRRGKCGKQEENFEQNFCNKIVAFFEQEASHSTQLQEHNNFKKVDTISLPA